MPTCVLWLYVMTGAYVWRGALICVTWRVDMYNATRLVGTTTTLLWCFGKLQSLTWLAQNLTCVIWHIDMRDIIPPHMSPASCTVPASSTLQMRASFIRLQIPSSFWRFYIFSWKLSDPPENSLILLENASAHFDRARAFALQGKEEEEYIAQHPLLIKVCLCLSINVCIYMYVYIYIFVWICIYKCMYTYMYTYVDTYQYTYIDEYICMYVYIYTYMYIYI